MHNFSNIIFMSMFSKIKTSSFEVTSINFPLILFSRLFFSCALDKSAYDSRMPLNLHRKCYKLKAVTQDTQ